MNIVIYNKNKIDLEAIVTIGYIMGSRAKRKGPASRSFLQHDISEREVRNGQKDSN